MADIRGRELKPLKPVEERMEQILRTSNSFFGKTQVLVFFAHTESLSTAAPKPVYSKMDTFLS